MMQKYFLDSSFFLHFYSRGDKTQRKRAKSILLQAKEKAIELYCGPPVFFEVAWILKSAYGLKNDEILNILEAMLGTPNLRVIDAELVGSAIALARSAQQGFSDSYIAATAQRLETGVITFNEKYFAALGVQLYLD
jgi:predicted nucleic acid-binding protein